MDGLCALSAHVSASTSSPPWGDPAAVTRPLAGCSPGEALTDPVRASQTLKLYKLAGIQSAWDLRCYAAVQSLTRPSRTCAEASILRVAGQNGAGWSVLPLTKRALSMPG